MMDFGFRIVRRLYFFLGGKMGGEWRKITFLAAVRVQKKARTHRLKLRARRKKSRQPSKHPEDEHARAGMAEMASDWPRNKDYVAQVSRLTSLIK
jgi:hypothetical protein